MFEAIFYKYLEAEARNGVHTSQKILDEETAPGERMVLLHEKLSQFKVLQHKYKQDRKSDLKAIKYKAKGNKSFVEGKYHEALKSYTKTLMTAESQQLVSITYANRSAALLKLELYEECLADIRRAFANNYPESLKAKVIVRRAIATHLSAERLKGNGTPKLTYHEQVPTIPTNLINSITPCAANSVKIKSCKTGKKVVAVKNIKIGDIIAVEESAATFIEGPYLYYCHECFELCYNPIPCNACTEVLYCDEACKQKAFLTYHQHECPILLSLRAYFGRNKFLILALKIFLRGAGPAPNEVIEHCLRRQCFRKEILLEIAAAVVYDLLKKYTAMFGGPQGHEAEDLFKHTFLALLKVCWMETAGIYSIRPLGDKIGIVYTHARVASGFYTFYVMIRHSCAPNAVSNDYGTKRVVRAIDTITKGQEVFVSYGPHYAKVPKEERQRWLDDYKFKCTCRACEENWAVMDPIVTCPLVAPAQPPSGDDHSVPIPRKRKPTARVAKVTIPYLIHAMRSFPTSEQNEHFISYQTILRHCYDSLANRRLIP